jgi:hypothetical protein
MSNLQINPAVHAPGNGNGHYPSGLRRLHLSRKSFLNGLPRRIGTIEDVLEVYERQLADLASRLTALEAQPERADLVATVDHLDERVRRLDRRSARTRRQVAVLADQVETRFE